MASFLLTRKASPAIHRFVFRMEASMLYVVGMIVVVTLAIGLLLYDLRTDPPR
jgi:hypothetical protein